MSKISVFLGLLFNKKLNFIIFIMKFFLISVFTFYTFHLDADENNISLTFDKDSAKYWQYISDRTMGGVSDGQAFLDKEGDLVFARLIGNVSTNNNGGFIQLRSTLSFINLNKENNKLKGIRLNVRGNGEIYHVFIRTSLDRSYRDYFSATFIADDVWKTVDIPFEKFTHRYSDNILDGSDLKTFGIVAYGRDFTSDVSISKITFYYK